MWLCFSQTTAEVIRGFEAAWRWFGGVFPVVIPDNMSPIVHKAKATAPRLNDTFMEYAQSRAFEIEAAPACGRGAGRQVGTGVPMSVAARMLGVTMPTVRSWIARGVPAPAPEARPAAVTTRSLGEALAAASQIRAAGKDERLLHRVVDELEDRRARAALGDRIRELDTRTPIDPDRVAKELFA